MNRSWIRVVHAAAGSAAFLCIALFLGSTVWVELLGGPEQVAAVKRAIARGLVLLVPAMVAVGLSGWRLGGTSRAAAVVAKQRRTRVIALNGMLVLVPAALVLDRLASAGDVGTVFRAVQAVEVIAGSVNLVLLGLNYRDGLRLSGRIRRRDRRGDVGADAAVLRTAQAVADAVRSAAR